MDGTGPPTDPLALGQRVVAVLETGARTATYKLAVLSALVGFCVEHLPADPAAALDVRIDALAERVIDDCTLAAARGLYRSSPAGTPTWQSRSRTGTWDTVFPPGWVVSAVPETGYA